VHTRRHRGMVDRSRFQSVAVYTGASLHRQFTFALG
jgi:hypothetical protein